MQPQQSFRGTPRYIVSEELGTAVDVAVTWADRCW
jgi:hypothetical protein